MEKGSKQPFCKRHSKFKTPRVIDIGCGSTDCNVSGCENKAWRIIALIRGATSLQTEVCNYHSYYDYGEEIPIRDESKVVPIDIDIFDI